MRRFRGGSSKKNKQQVHAFATGVTPTWFFEGCSRDDAESILTRGKRYGNVLMRESVTFKNTGSYVISMRREVVGGTQLHHYQVQRTPHGYKINVDNRHAPMKTLNEVMDFFVRQAGPGTKAMSTGDLNKIGLPGLLKNNNRGRLGNDDDSGFDDHERAFDDVDDHSPAKSFPSPPPMPPTWAAGDASSSSGSSFPQHSGAGSAWSQTNNRLKFSGNIPQELYTMGRQVEYDMGKRKRSFDTGMSFSGGPPPPPPPPVAPPAPPPPPPPGMPGTGPPPDNGFASPHLNQTVPPKTVPSQTLQRNGGFIEQRFDKMYLNQDEWDENDEPSSPHSPPPLPGGHPSMGGPPPPPPPIGGGGAPPPPPMAGYNTTKPLPRTPVQNSQPMGYNTTPAPERPRPGLARPPSFESELKNRLVSQREQIYSDGATILKSGNW